MTSAPTTGSPLERILAARQAYQQRDESFVLQVVGIEPAIFVRYHKLDPRRVERILMTNDLFKAAGSDSVLWTDRFAQGIVDATAGEGPWGVWVGDDPDHLTGLDPDRPDGGVRFGSHLSGLFGFDAATARGSVLEFFGGHPGGVAELARHFRELSQRSGYQESSRDPS